MMRTNAINHSYTGTADAVKIMDADAFREYICFYAVSGDCLICIGGNGFDSNAIKLEAGVMWEPKQVLTGEVWFKTLDSVLTVLY